MITARVAQRARLALPARFPATIATPIASRIPSQQWSRYASGGPRKPSRAPITPDKLSYTPARSRATRQAEPEKSATEFNTAASPSKNTTPNAQPGPQSRVASKSNLGEPSKATGEFNTSASPEKNTFTNTQPGPGAGPIDGVQSRTAGDHAGRSINDSQSHESETDSQKGEPSAQKPLPDLRYGIPSTFGEEFMKQAQAAEKDSASAPDNDLNITDEPGHGPRGSGRRGGDGEGELPRSAYETSIDKRRNRTANVMYLLFAVFGTTGALYLGRNWESEEEAKMYPDAPSGWSPGLVYGRMKARMGGQMGYYTEPTFPKLLPNMDPNPPYTLVISLEDLMIHSGWSREHGWRTAKRPGIDHFLRYLSQYYELVLFTSMPLAYADAIVRKLDPYHIIMWPLFREATRYEKGQYIKDLSYLNRDLSRVIILDTKAEHVQAQPENAILLKPWQGDSKDKELVSYIPFLEYIASMGIGDVRQALKSFEGTDIPTEYARREAALREAFNKQMAEQKGKKPRVSGVGFLNSALGMKSQGGGLTVDGQSSVADGLAEGKMLMDQIRERGMKQYLELEKQIRENGEMWLKEEAEMEKKAQAEQMKSAKNWATGFIGTPKKEAEAIEKQ